MIICPYCSSSIAENLKICPVCGGSLDIAYPTCEPLSEGSVINEKYRIEKVLGSGGFGITYLAYDEKLDRKVAVKEYFPDGVATRTGNKVTIPPTLDNNENIQGFKNEAKSIAKLRNPGIVNVYDVIEENDTVYIVMEYIEGEPFSSLLGKIDEKAAVKYMRHIAEAIGYVHIAGLLHQDIKPENIILTKDGIVKIIDFGSSRVFAADKTKTYEKILTPGYAPLEQYGGRGKRGEYTDVYAICATLYALLKGFPPPESTELAGGAEIDYSGISENLKNILKKGLSVKIPERIQNTLNLIKLFDELDGSDNKIIGQATQNTAVYDGLNKNENIDTELDKHDIETSLNNVKNSGIQAQANKEGYPNHSKKSITSFFSIFLVIAAVLSLIAATYIYYPYILNIFKGFTGESMNKTKLKESMINKKNIKNENNKKSKETKSINVNANASETSKTYTSNHSAALSKPLPHPHYIRQRPVPQIVQAPSIFRSSPNVFHGQGYKDFSISGCFYCHIIYGKGSKNGSNLSHVGSQLSLPQIENKITHPNSSMPPNPNMPTQEVEQIAGWLESLK